MLTHTRLSFRRYEMRRECQEILTGLLLGPFVAFFGTGYYTGFAAVTAEIYDTRVRSTAQGFTYNVGRIASAAAPFTVGSLAQKHGFGAAFAIGALSFLLAAFFWIWIPETKGRELLPAA